MKTKNIISLVALTLVMAACTSDDITQLQPTPNGNTVFFSATINSGNVVTRGLTEATDGKSIIAKWEVEEIVALVHSKTIDVLPVTSVDDNGIATISGNIQNATNDENVYVVYLGKANNHMSDFVSIINAKLEEDETLTAITEGMIITAMDNMMSAWRQDGTVEGIAQHSDYRYGTGKLAVNGEKASFKNAVTIKSQHAVWKLTLKDGNNNSINAANLTINDSEISITPSEPTNVLYVAFKPASGKTYVISATTPNYDTYGYEVKASLEAGKFYYSTVAMVKPISYEVGSWTSTDGLTFTTVQTTSYTILESSESDVTWSAGTYVVNSNVTIGGNVTITGDVNIILCDKDPGAESPNIFSVNGSFSGDYTLNIYGQTKKEDFTPMTSPRFVINLESMPSAEVSLQVKNLNLHGATTAFYNANGIAIKTDNINVYGGRHNGQGSNTDAKGIVISEGFNVYEGEIAGIGADIGITAGTGGLNIYGGNVEGGATTVLNSNNTYGTGILGSVTISNGTLTASGGSGFGDDKNGGPGIDCGTEGTLTVTGGMVRATGGYNNIAISGAISLGTYIKLYEGDSENPTTEAADQTICTKQYALIY